MKIEKIHLIVFLVSFLVGCAVIYYSPIEHKTIFVYPTPSNVGSLQYKDAVGTCFEFSAKDVKCEGTPQKIPEQE